MWNENEGSNGTALAEVDAQLADMPIARMSAVHAPAGDGSPMALMVQAAQGLVRQPAAMIASAKQIGGLLGKSGFYSFPAGAGTVEGPSVGMAQALAQQWGGIMYQVRIVDSEALAGGGTRVHLRASVADMKSLVACEVDQVVTTSPAPGKFANKPEQKDRWNGMQLQSAASKIVRNAILRVLPAWFVDPAFDAAKLMDAGKALGGHKTLEAARVAAAEALKGLGCTTAELEQYLGQPLDMWAVPQLSALRELYGNLRDGATSIEAWRAGLVEKTGGTAAQINRSALGIPAASSAKPVEAEPQKAEPEKAKKRDNGTATAAGELPLGGSK
jgi:hypothetical protein